MSFKREGDDASQLNLLQKRRVADLLSNFIPEDEAALLKNGRYTCLVCAHRPVFDTVDMLTVHRKGKRHLEGLRSFYGRKTRLKEEIAKRQHENYVRDEESATKDTSCPAPLLAQTRRLTRHALLRTAPYDSRHRRVSTKCEKVPQKVQEDRTASGPAGPGESGGPWDADTALTAGSPAGGVAAQEVAPLSTETTTTVRKRRELEHYLRLKSQGWVQDGSGGWTKDEKVEFDSDEDEPPPLSPAAANETEG